MCACARAIRLLPVLVLVSAAGLHAQSVDDIVAKNILAKGGAEKLRAVQSIKITGTLVGPGDKQAPFTLWSKRPNMARQEATINGTTMVRAFDGTSAWLMMGTDVQEITGPQARTSREQAEFDSPLLDYKDKGSVIELAETQKIAGSSVYHLKLTSKSGQVQHYYLDADTGLEKRTSVTVSQPGQSMTLVTELGDYRDVNGIKIPFSVKQIVNDTPVSTLTIATVEFNSPIDDAIFRMPRKP